MRRVYNLDALLILKDAGLVAADAAAQVGGQNRILEVGNARFEAVAVLDVTAVEIASNDELFRIIVQGSTSATFASDIENLAEISFGATEVRSGGKDSVPGRYELGFCNEQNDLVYPYIRLYIEVAGTVATGINFSAYAAPINWG